MCAYPVIPFIHQTKWQENAITNKKNMGDIFEKLLAIINDIENDQIQYSSVEANKDISRKIDVPTLKDQS